MLLDQKRTKRVVQIVAILTSIAFVGTIFIVMGIVLFGGGSSPEREQVDEQRAIVDDNPQSADAWQQLASAHIAAGDLQEAVVAARQAVELAPNSFRNVSTLVLALQQAGDEDAAVDALQDFTAANPRNSEAFLQLGVAASAIGRTAVARLAFQRYLQLEPDSARADFVRQQLQALGGAPAPPGG